ncbi:NAD-dependent deacylase [Chloroflexi bacterium TSY]|nr:NAD-dependent deacylase [Chloroflexi bacterium TSY]
MNIQTFQDAAKILADADSIACLTGAGVSAESGIATFRDPQTGHWAKFDPEKLASVAGFLADPGLVWRWYMERLYGCTEEARPNPGHFALASLEEQTRNFTLVTQNVDNLHEQAGSQHVIHLHGNISRFHCNDCTMEHSLQPAERSAELPPSCVHCGGMVRPSVVWFGEALPLREIESAWQAAEKCDVMLVVGTSGIVYPAAHLPYIVQENGATVIDVNPEFSALSGMADLFLQGPSGEILPTILEIDSSTTNVRNGDTL